MTGDQNSSGIRGRLESRMHWWKFKASNLKTSIAHLVDEFGGTNSIGLGLVVNLGLAAIGILVYWHYTGIVAYAGAVWAILNVLGIIKWVFQL